MPENMHSLSTRIKLKYDTYENWIAKDPVLLAGEVAIATVASNDAEGKPGFQNLPNIVFKVGDGSSKYSALKFVSALAADVHGWAKAADKPVYTAQEIDGIKKYIDDIIAGTDNIQDTDTKYLMETMDEETYKFGLYSTNKAGENKTLVSTLDLSGIDGRLDTVEAAIGPSGAVSQQIANAIAALDYSGGEFGEHKFATKITETDGMIEATYAQPVIADVDGLQDALDSKQDNLVIADNYNGESNPVATKATVTAAVANLEGAMHFRGKVTGATLEEAIAASDIKDWAAGDVILWGEYEYVFDGTNWLELGNTSLYYLKAEAEAAHEAMQKEIDNLETSKQDALGFEGTYNKETNKVVTKDAMTGAISTAVGALDYAGGEFADHKFATKVTETDGVIEVTYAQPVIADIGGLETRLSGIDGEIAKKQDTVTFADGYEAGVNNAATVATVTNAIAGIANADAAVEGQFVTAVPQANGAVTVARAAVTTDHIQQGTKPFVLDCGTATL